MRQKLRILAAFSLAAAVMSPSAAPAASETTVTFVGTMFVPAVVQVAVGSSLTFVNAEAMDYPQVMGTHNVIADGEVAGLAGAKPFPISSPLLKPGDKWTCAGTATGLSCSAYGQTRSLSAGTYALKCGIHPNQSRGLLVIG